MQNNIFTFIVNQTTSGNIDKETAVEMIAMLKQGGAKVQDDIAIIGMSARLPGAQDIHEYWNNIENGIDTVKQIPQNRKNDTDDYIKFKQLDQDKIIYPEYGYLEDIDGFDYEFFRMSPREASLTDPHQRIFLEQAWKAIEDAGYGGDRLTGSKTGVYLGYTQSPKDLYCKMIMDIDPTLIPIATVGNMQAMAATRISYLLNLKGPALVVDTACSSALVAIELACQAIKTGQCDQAIAGGIKLNIIPVDDENIRIGIESGDWRTRAFDDTADGSGVGEGAGALLLKPLKKALKDGDHIYAVIKGNAANHDGQTAGITVPNPASQTSVIQQAWEESGIDPETLDYIETHGTGTILGDPIEIRGIEGAFKKYTNKKQFCAISSVKTNIGHLSEAAGIASIVKMALSLKYKKLPPTIYFQKPHSSISFTDSPLYVNTKLRDWETDGHPRRGGVSGFGMSGTNCHLVLEEAPEQANAEPSSAGPEVFTLSARSSKALRELLQLYDEYLQQSGGNSTLSNICFTANTGRSTYAYRLALMAADLDDLHVKIRACLEADLESFTAPWAFYGFHRVARANAAPKPGEIDEQEKRHLGGEAAQHLESWIASGKLDEQSLHSLCSTYASGGDVNWTELYEGERRLRVSLPTYALQNARCWLDFPELEASEETKEDGLYFAPVWTKEERSAKSGEALTGAVLLIGGAGDSKQMAEALEAAYAGEQRDTIQVSLGEEYIQHHSGAYTIRNTQGDYIRLFEDIGAGTLQQIVHMLNLDSSGPIDSVEQLDESQKRGLYSLFYLYKAWLHTNGKQQLDVVLLTDSAQEVSGVETHIRPEHATAIGFGKVVSKEHPQFNVRSIDRDQETDAGQLKEEIMYGTGSSPYAVAFRAGSRYIEQFAQMELDRMADEPVAIKEQGVYLITGGTGGIGLEVAKSLAARAASVNLVLVNRSAMPDREQWDAIAQTGTDLPSIHKINAIRELEAAGAQIKLCQANISDESELRAMLSEVRSEYGKIDGIVHGAGVAIDQLLKDKQENVIREVLLPKVNGTWLLNKWTEEDQLDFFVMFSSVATIYYGSTQSDYVAANAYMDSFTHYRSRQGKKSLTINWTTWKETGMAKNSGVAVSTIFQTLPTSSGIEGFTALLNKQSSRALIGSFNYDRLGIILLEKATVRLSEPLQRRLDYYKQQLGSSGSSNKAAKPKAAAKNGEVQLTGRDGAAYNETEKTIAAVCQNALGYAEIDINDNFFELGADSILLMRIHAELDKRYTGLLTVADMFEHTTISKLAEYIVEQDAESSMPQQTIAAREALSTDSDIAVIGMSFQFPKASTNEEFWGALQAGVDNGSGYPDVRRKDMEKYVAFKGWPLNAVDYEQGSYLDEIDKFDYRFFRMSPKEASTTDPNHRLFLQTAWHAIEDAGYGGKKIYGTKTGVYLGFASNMVYFHRFISEVEPQSEGASLVGNTASVATGRVSYLFDLKGPSVVIDTACSSSLTSVHLACKSIRMGDCEMAIAGGVRLNMMPIFRKGSPRGIGMESGDGKTRAFDELSEGTGTGEGVGAILLKPLQKAIEDRDNIYAVIKGSASNQDGSSAGLTAPNPAAQEEVIIQAWEDAAIDPETVTYIETHGTGTQLGDPIEIQGIGRAFKRYTQKKQFCAVGSSKTNLTHLSEAAGIAGVIKAVLTLKNKELPPNLYFNRPNRKIDFMNSPVYVNATRKLWETEGHPRRCGVSGFGMSGTNCHVVMEEYLGAETLLLQGEEGLSLRPQLFTLSALTETALRRLVSQYKSQRFGDGSAAAFRNACYTANTGRGHYAHRLILIVNDVDDFNRKLSEVDEYGFDNLKQPWLYYGYHKIVSETKAKKSEGEISESQRISMTKQFGQLVDDYVDGERSDDTSLPHICELYVQGVETDWEPFYFGEELHRISLPTYPFERERCWVEIPEYEQAVTEVTAGGLYYGGQWVRQEQLMAEQTTQAGPVLIFMDEKGLGQSLADEWNRKGTETVQVYLRKQYAKLDDGSYHISGTVEDYVKLLRDNKGRTWSKMIHLFSIVPEGMAVDWNGFNETQYRGVYSLFYLSKAVAQVGLSAVTDTVIISDHVDVVSGRESRVNPWNAPLLALGKSARQELPSMLCRAIDIDEATSLETVMREILAAPSYYMVAFRDNERYAEIFKEYRVQEANEQPIEVREEGIYLITGGTGGMGIETARYLAARKQVNIALINRTPLPDKGTWDDIIDRNSRTDRKAIQRMKAVREIEAMGAHVECYSLDIANLQQMEELVGGLRERYGRINGIVHGAGVGGDGFLYLKEEQVFNEVVHPKVFGTWILDKLTEQDRPDFFLMFSSMSSRFAVPGQGDYCAANTFLDAFAKHKTLNQQKALSINWVAWKETGMAVEFGVNADGAFKALPTAVAMRGLDEALNRSVSNVLIGELNYGSDLLWELGLVPQLLDAPIDAAITGSQKRWEARQLASQRRFEGEIKLTGKDGEYTDLETKLAEIYCEVLGFNEIDMDDNFFELGGDSILLGRVHASLEKHYPGKVRLLDLFEYTSVSKLQQYMREDEEEQDTAGTEALEHLAYDREMSQVLQQVSAGASLEEDTKRLMEELDKGTLSIEQAIDQLTKTGQDSSEARKK
ncbi:SDR family NAD(P)-dependent oxidoreductase [Paenibacillus sp. FSL H8-0537]|uniref:SDR family NAD(P)-dependent oxidoreductase n=1 Tax=Paenibacillus sp. FSL H8-0537 TaxID=2921399 RepID=UPI0031017388